MAHRSAAAIAAIAWVFWLHGCSSEDKPAQGPGPDEPAGVVVAAAGQVTAVRADQPARTLAVGAEVFRDDTVTTAADGSVAIELGHNRVTWNLASGQSMRVDQSLAWKAKPASGSSSFDERAEMVTSSAGQHGGREAAVDSFALDSKAEAAEESAIEGEARGSAIAASEASIDAEVQSKPKSRAHKASRKKGGSAASGSGALALHESDALAPPAKQDVVRALASGDEASASAPAPQGGAAAVPSEPAPAPARALRIGKVAMHEGERTNAAVIQPMRSKLSACRATKDIGRLMLTLTIAADGRVTSATASSVQGLSSDTRACILDSARKLRYPSAKAVAKATVEIRFQR